MFAKCLQKLTPSQLKEHMIVMRQDGMTYQAIAEAVGLDDDTVREHISQIGNPISQITNIRGQKRPAKYKPRQPKTVIATTKVQEKKAMESITEAGEALPDVVQRRYPGSDNQVQPGGRWQGLSSLQPRLRGAVPAIP